MQISPLAGALGAEVSGIDLKDLSEKGWKEIHSAFVHYSVLAIRDQKLEPADIMAVGRRFGEPCHYPFVTGMDEFPYIFEVVKEPEETRNFGGAWHSDTAYLKQPPLFTNSHSRCDISAIVRRHTGAGESENGQSVRRRAARGAFP